MFKTQKRNFMSPIIPPPPVFPPIYGYGCCSPVPPLLVKLGLAGSFIGGVTSAYNYFKLVKEGADYKDAPFPVIYSGKYDNGDMFGSIFGGLLFGALVGISAPLSLPIIGIGYFANRLYDDKKD